MGHDSVSDGRVKEWWAGVLVGVSGCLLIVRENQRLFGDFVLSRSLKRCIQIFELPQRAHHLPITLKIKQCSLSHQLPTHRAHSPIPRLLGLTARQ